MEKPEQKKAFSPQAFLAKVGSGKAILHCRKDRIIFTQGDVADKVFYIQSGKVKLTVVSEQGKEAVVGILEPEQFFGEACLNGHTIRIGTAKALEPCIITSITRKAMLAALRKEPKFSELFVTYLLTRSSRVEEDLIDQLFNSSEKRLARLLLLLANFGKDEKPTPIDASINQETLAEMIGTTRSRVSFFLKQIPQAWTDQLQWKAGSASLTAECSALRKARDQHGRKIKLSADALYDDGGSSLSTELCG